MGERQFGNKIAAVAGRGFQFDFTTMELDDFLAERKTDPVAFGNTLCIGASVERVENFGMIFNGDADALVVEIYFQ